MRGQANLFKHTLSICPDASIEIKQALVRLLLSHLQINISLRIELEGYSLLIGVCFIGRDWLVNGSTPIHLNNTIWVL